MFQVVIFKLNKALYLIITSINENSDNRTKLRVRFNGVILKM